MSEQLPPLSIIPVKRPVGRPRREGTGRPHIEIKGVVDKPVNNITELSHPNLFNVLHQQKCDISSEIAAEVIIGSPILFKQMINLFKGYNCEHVKIKFNADSVEFISHSVTCGAKAIYLKIDGEKLASYYCLEPFEIYIKQSMLTALARHIKKSLLKVTLLSYVSSKNLLLHYMFENTDTTISDNFFAGLFSPTLTNDAINEFTAVESELEMYKDQTFIHERYPIVFSTPISSIKIINECNSKYVTIKNNPAVSNKSLSLFCEIDEKSSEDRNFDQVTDFEQVDCSDLFGMDKITSHKNTHKRFEILSYNIQPNTPFYVNLMTLSFKPIIMNIKDNIMVYLPSTQNANPIIKVVNSHRDGNRGRDECAEEATYKVIVLSSICC